MGGNWECGGGPDEGKKNERNGGKKKKLERKMKEEKVWKVWMTERRINRAYRNESSCLIFALVFPAHDDKQENSREISRVHMSTSRIPLS